MKRHSTTIAYVLLLGVLQPLPAADKGSTTPEIRMRQVSDERVLFEVTGLDPTELEQLAKLKADSPRWNEIFTVSVRKSGEGSALPSMLGTHRLDDNVLVFEPRFPPTRGLSYLAVLERSKIPQADAKPRIEKQFTIPKPPEAATTLVEKIFPTAARLPENQLKLYLHFSAPMSRGDAYSHIHLIDDKGKEVAAPFLELGEELWDPEGKRFTLFFDPGRIKRGVKPREDLGPPLTAGRSYSFRVDRAWKDVDGNPLKEDFVKKFTVTEPIEERVDIARWKLEAPSAGGSEPLKLQFPRPMDHALLHRMIWVTNDQGDRIAGTISLANEETRWRFEPAKAWKPGKYHLVIDKALEDLAGNSIAAPFEVDVFKPIPRDPKVETAKIDFDVR